uniref:RNA helicase n=1 Tax=Bicosoecida sp. CB-2014 TaxID=1486930 RepID=A0A7S1CH90_9STRA|mmetsp:Transcript_2472/g.8416  ORF Transcript_2472/g.8416 Transcript_2472/m.8416 type:complete len:755 (+) Transcript_2472:454-2718(+)
MMPHVGTKRAEGGAVKRRRSFDGTGGQHGGGKTRVGGPAPPATWMVDPSRGGSADGPARGGAGGRSPALSAPPSTEPRVKRMLRRNGDPLGGTRRRLPIAEYREQIVSLVKGSRASVIVGETGSGKTTQIPQFLFDAGMARKGLIVVTQPRRVAAVTVAQRVAEEMGTRVGEGVGYTIRFDDTTTPRTAVKFATDGMLLREAQVDPTLKRYSVIMLDEAHERTLSTDVLFAVVKRAMASRPELRVVVMSATLNVKLFAEYFGAKALSIPGRQHPVEVFYLSAAHGDYIDAALTAVLQIHVDEPPGGDVLVFLPGQEDIENMAAILKRKAKLVPDGVPALKVCQLYSALPPAAQLEAFAPAPKGARKVLLATNIAETSVTINGVRYVVDPGLVKERKYAAGSGMEMLDTVETSRAQAWQRAGRAGREAPGKCFRLYTEAHFLALAATPVPEIRRVSLAAVALRLKAMGAGNVQDFPFLEPPERPAVRRALHELLMMGALAKDGELTKRGTAMAALPLEPRYGLLVIKAQEFGCGEEILSLVALLSVEGLFFSPRDKQEAAAKARRKFVAAEGDHCTLLNVLRAFEEEGSRDRSWCHDHFVNERALRRALDIRHQLRGVCSRIGVRIESCSPDTEPVLRCLVAACFLSIAKRIPAAKGQAGTRAHYKTLEGGHEVWVHPMSVLFGRNPAPETIVYNEVVITKRQYLRCVSIVAADWLPELAPQCFQAVSIAGPSARGNGSLSVRPGARQAQFAHRA